MYFFLRITPPILITEGCKGFTDWLPGWRRNNFITSKGEPVKNMKLIKYMDALHSSCGHSGQQISLQHVHGHVDKEENEGPDALAVRGAKLHKVEEPDWDALRFRLDEEADPKREAIPNTGLEDANISVSHPKILCLFERLLRTVDVY